MLDVNVNADTIFIIKFTLTITVITVYCTFYTVNKSSSLKKAHAIVEWILWILDIWLRYLLTCEILTVFIFGVLLVKSANSSKIKPNIDAIQHITCRLIRFHLYLLIQFEFVCTTYPFSWWSCFVYLIYILRFTFYTI